MLKTTALFNNACTSLAFVACFYWLFIPLRQFHRKKLKTLKREKYNNLEMNCFIECLIWSTIQLLLPIITFSNFKNRKNWITIHTTLFTVVSKKMGPLFDYVKPRLITNITVKPCNSVVLNKSPKLNTTNMICSK